MKYIDAELIKSTKGLYNDIDSCIDELLKARFDHNQENEGKALFRMEGLMVATLQQLDCIIDSLQEEQEVNLEKEIIDYWTATGWCQIMTLSKFKEIAHHFDELRLKARKEKQP